MLKYNGGSLDLMLYFFMFDVGVIYVLIGVGYLVKV